MPEEKNRAPKPKYNLFQMSWWMVRRAAKHSMTVLPYAVPASAPIGMYHSAPPARTIWTKAAK